MTRAVYLPPGCRWYEVSHLLTRATWQEQEAGQVTVAAPLDTLPLHLRGGHILPLQQPASNTATSRANPLELLGNIIELQTNLREVYAKFYKNSVPISCLLSTYHGLMPV